jgi:uncharacterized protein with von Willebrand factor type A (vWA) domain
MSALLNNLLVFGRLLRALGIDVHLGRLLDVIAALQHVDLGRRDEVYHACRALLVHRHEHLDIFDRAFAAFWRDQSQARQRAPARRGSPASFDPAIGAPFDDRAGRADGQMIAVGGEGDDAHEPTREVGVWSEAGGLADKDFAQFTEREIALARDALDRLTWNPGDRRTRRWVPGRGSRVDLRRALARSLRTGGDVVILPKRRRRMRPRTVVLLCDVSGSMERYSRMLVHFAHALGIRHRRLEVFLFSTRLTRISRQIRIRRLDAAAAAVSHAVPDWSGGTRIGEALREFHQRWSRRVMHGGPVVLLVSDGWDRGDPAVLRDQIARLQRSSHRLIWLNPLIGTANYAPLTRGLQAALPFVDDFLPVRTLNNLAALAVHLNTIGGLRAQGPGLRAVPGRRSI